MQVYVLSSHHKFTALVVVHAQEDSSFVIQVDFQYVHYFLVLKYLEFGLEPFLVFVHIQVHVHIPLFEHQYETEVENYEFFMDLKPNQALQEPLCS